VPAAYGASTVARRASGSRDISVMSRPAKVTESDSRRSRLPPHTGQSVLSM
jgi:hypothetical protein